MSRLFRNQMNQRSRSQRGGLTSRSLQSEKLEPRQLLAVISEFQALNASTLQDGQGDFSDWIEIRNPSFEALNLNGYYLTDDASNLTKWQFPEVVLGPGEEILVFASSKFGQADLPASEIHTNFKLSGSGDYLGLIKPDGLTVEFDFGATYPNQFEDQSYGLAVGRDTATLLDGDLPVKTFVPTDGSLGQDWTQVGFNDATWNAGTTPVGFEQLSEGFTIRDEFNELGDEWTVSIPDGGTSTVNVLDNGKVAIVSPAGQTEAGLNPLIYRALPDGVQSFNLITQINKNNDDGNPGIFVMDAATGRPALTLEYHRDLQFRMIDSEGESLGSKTDTRETSFFLRLELDAVKNEWNGYYKIAEADEWILVATASADAFPDLRPSNVGILTNTTTAPVVAQFDFFEIDVPDQSPVYQPQINADLGASMLGVNSSVYMRIPFNVAGDPGRFDELELSTSHDDGFIAYLNGVELTAQNVPVDATWNSSAAGGFGAVGGNIPTRVYNVGASLNALVAGQNVLSIHAMNESVDNSDLFFQASLSASEILEESAQFFTVPTPNASNELPAAPMPIMIGQQGIFFGSTIVELSMPQPNASLDIRYTLDGSPPTTTSPKYTGPITLTESAMLEAKTFDPAANPKFTASIAASGTFFALDEELRDRTSDLPIIILDSLGQRLQATSSTTLTPVNVLVFETDRTTNRASLDGGDINYIGRGGVRDRGSSSSGLPKPNMAFETWGPNGTDLDDDENEPLLGMGADSDWVLYAASSFDTAQIHNQFAFDLSNQIGQWAPDFRNVEVFFNRGDGVITNADYHGVYALHEKVTVGAHRLDIAPIDPSVTATPEEAAPGEPNISGGYVWKVDRGDPGEPAFSAGGQSLNWVDPKSPRSTRSRPDQLATEQQEDWVQDYLGQVTDSIRNTTIDDPNGYTNLIDVEAFVEHHLLNVLTFNVDAFRLSGYLHKDRDGKVAYGPVWDFDRALNSTDGRDANPLVWRSETGDRGTDFFNYGPWYSQLFNEPGFWQEYIDTWHELRLNEFSNNNLDAIVDRLAGEIRESQARERADCTVCRSIRPRGGWEAEIENMKIWLHDRAGFIDSNFAQPTLVQSGGEFLARTLDGLSVTPGQEIEIVPTPINVNNDTPLFNDANGGADASFFVPIDNDLGDTWTEPGFNDAAWIQGKMGVGLGDDADFQANYTTTVRPQDFNADATTVFIRIPFNVDNLDDFEQLVLKMKYDDGFVAYLNGVQIKERNLRDPLAWDGRANSHRNSEAIEFEDFDITEFKDNLKLGENVLAIRGINATASSGDMLFLASLAKRNITFEPSPTGEVYFTTDGTDPRGPDGNPSASATLLNRGQKLSFTENTKVIARNLDASDRGSESGIVLSDWSGPTEFNYIVDNPSLAITEINYNPVEPTQAELAAWNPENGVLSSTDFEWIEIKNTGTTTANLTGVKLSDGVDFDFAQEATLAPGAYGLIVENADAFALRYGAGPVLGQFTGNLSNTGEDIDLTNGTGDVLFSVFYGDNDPWPVRADGVGGTLELINASATAAVQGKYYSWQGSTKFGGTPGADGSPSAGIVINEVLSNPANPNTDSIEIYNSSDIEKSLGGMYLSDSSNNLLTYKIPAGTSVSAGGYIVLTSQDFGQGDTGFGISSRGDDIWLVEADNAGNILRFVDDVHFGASSNGESLGRVPNGSGRLAPMLTTTLGQANSNPRVGPVIISELNYDPPTPNANAIALYPNLGKSDIEFVEVFNPTNAEVDLTDWRLRGGVQFEFDAGTKLAANRSIVVVSFDAEDPENAVRVEAFRTQFGIGDEVALVGGYNGQLSNADDEVRLLQPETVAPNDLLRFIADEVLYDDQTPWPVGVGQSIQRRSADAYGNLAASWLSASPTPGIVNFGEGGRGDFNGDNLVNLVDVEALWAESQKANPDVAFDLNADGTVDRVDRDIMIHDIIRTTYGDTDLNGSFTSRDLVNLFVAGEFEDNIPGNSTFATGDWNADGDFTTSDLVVAFQDGGYINAAVAENTSAVAAAVGDSDAEQGVSSHDDPIATDFISDGSREIELDALVQDQIFENGAWMDDDELESAFDEELV